jgi:hypothetical protein
MTPTDPRPDRVDEILVELTEEHVELDDDVIELDAETWAIHGSIPYDGEIIAATFVTEHEAREVLARDDDLRRRRRP